MEQAPHALQQAIRDFREARRRAILEEILARLTGRPADLLSFEETRRKLGTKTQIERGLEQIPLDAIVGSVGRYQDFTRHFLPRKDSMADRWARVKTVATNSTGWPPVELYQIGEAYFVLDGNHRVSVARQLGMTHIEAYVTEVQTTVPLTPDVGPDELICQAQYAAFLASTMLDQLRPGVDLSVTAPGAYRTVDEHIAVHRYYLGQQQGREIPYQEAVTSWYDTVYKPVARMIEEKGLLVNFPNRTVTDLYLWIAEHQAELQETLGWQVEPGTVATHLASHHSHQSDRLMARIGEKIKDVLVPDELEPGPEPGEWRKEHLTDRRDDRLLVNLLVPVSGEEQSWCGLEQALLIAQREGSRLRGLHMVRKQQDLERPDVLAVQSRFEDRCQEVGLAGNLIIDVGPVARTIIDRARWNDLVVLNLAHPPGEKVLERLGSGLSTIIQHCPRPILAVPGKTSQLKRPLVAYDASPKAEEALFLATYLALQWDLPLVIAHASDEEEENDWPLERAGVYLEGREIQTEFVAMRGKPAEALLETAAQRACDFLIIGGYGSQPMIRAVLGSTADWVLRQSKIPVLICQ